MSGIVAYGAYVPHHRLLLSRIGASLGGGAAKGSRAVASYDEDATSMGVEAGRTALRGVPHAAGPARLYFATTALPYLDKTNAAVIHAALDLPRSVLAVDMGGAPRSAIGAILAAAESTEPAMAVLSDVRTGLPGGADERQGGDAAAALMFGPGSVDLPVLAELVTSASVTSEFLDRWRLPGEPASHVWEERFGDHVYGPLVGESFATALKQAGITADEVDHLIVCGLSGRAVRAFAKSSGARREAVAPDLGASIGNAGTAQPGVLLADVLDRAGPDEVIALVLLADGATTLILRTTDAPRTGHTSAPTVAEQVAAGDDSLSYAQFLTWRGMLTREPPRRPEPDAPAAPPTHRSESWKYGFNGSRCDGCETVNMPPNRVCYHCGATDRMSPVSMAEVSATVATYTVDRLAFTPSPPMVAVVLDFDGGGRFRCELTDTGPDDVAIGIPVVMTFRKLLTAHGVHNYFWKARPVRIPAQEV